MVRRTLIALGVSALAVPIVAIGGLGSAGAAPSMVRLSGSTLPSARLAADNPTVARRPRGSASRMPAAPAGPGQARRLGAGQVRRRASARYPPVPHAGPVPGPLLAHPGLGRHGVGVAGVPGPQDHGRAGQPRLRRGRGSAARVEKAFQDLSLVTVDANGKQRRVSTSEPAVPANLIASIDGVTGLSDVLMRPTHVGGADEAPATASSQAAEAAAAAVGADAPPTPGFHVPRRRATTFWNEKQAARAAALRQLPEPAAVGDLRLQAGSAPPRHTAPPASWPVASTAPGSRWPSWTPTPRRRS